MPITPVGGGIVYLESTQKLIILMRTVIFILALTALSTPVFTAAALGDAVTCTDSTALLTCNMCIANSGGTATTACFDCKAGYFLTFTSETTGTCNRCAAGTGIAAGTAVNDAAKTTRVSPQQSQASCTACHSTCARCYLPNSVASCSKCALDTYTTAAASGGVATCSGTCTAGMTRAAGTDTDFTATQAAETSSVCSVNCHASCGTCRGSAATGCTKCAAYYYATVFDTTAKTATCSVCPDGKTRATGSANTLGDVEASSVCGDNCHASCASCKGTAETGCTKCAIGRYASDWAAASSTAKCSSECDAGKTRDVAAAVLAGNEDKATICVNCNIACAECKGTAGTVCTKCAAGHFLSARTGTEVVGTCTACGDGKGKDADAAIFTGTSATTTKEDGCKATCTAASNCGVCSAAKPDECLTCPTGKTLDAATKKCPATASTGGSSASLVQALCGASLAAYALF